MSTWDEFWVSYAGFTFPTDFNQLILATAYLFGSVGIESLGNTSVVAYRRTDRLYNYYTAEWLCMDVLNEATIGVVSAANLVYTWALKPIRFYYLFVAVGYLYKGFAAILQAFSYCYTTTTEIAVRRKPNWGDLFTARNFWGTATDLLADVFSPGRIEIIFDWAAVFLCVWYNDWVRFMWFGPVAIMNLTMESYLVIDLYRDLPAFKLF